MHRPFSMALTLALLCAATSGCAHATSDAERALIVNEEQRSATLAVLDRYMAAVNALDFEAHVATYHFPHFRHARGETSVWQDAREAMPLLAVPPEERAAAARTALGAEWARSEWLWRDIVQAGPRKVHVATRIARLRADGSVIHAFDSLYVMTLEPDVNGAERWGIRGRSSFAPR